MPDKSGLQLLPETRKKIEVTIPGENRLLFIGVVFLLLAVVAVAGLYYYKNTITTKITDLDTQISNLEKNRNAEAEDKILVLNKQLSLISNIIDNHIFWTKGFGKLESLLQSQIQITSLDASTEKIDLRGIAPSYTMIAKQIAAFYSDQNNSIQDLELGNINALTNGKLEFSITLKLDKDKFLKNK